MEVRLRDVIREYLIAHGYEIQEETPEGGIWIKPDSVSGYPAVCSFEWAIKDCLEREGWFSELNKFLAEH